MNSLRGRHCHVLCCAQHAVPSFLLNKICLNQWTAAMSNDSCRADFAQDNNKKFLATFLIHSTVHCSFRLVVGRVEVHGNVTNHKISIL